MAERLTFYRLFNKHADEFCRDLVSTFPEVSEFKQLKSALLLIKNLDERKPRDVFVKFLTSEIRDSVLNKDETFFLTEVHNHKHIINHVEDADASQWDNIVNMLRNLWETLDDTNKDSIWKYFHVLVAISDKCG
jgi:uncharacterized protein (UPF0332 family)